MVVDCEIDDDEEKECAMREPPIVSRNLVLGSFVLDEPTRVRCAASECLHRYPANRECSCCQSLSVVCRLLMLAGAVAPKLDGPASLLESARLESARRRRRRQGHEGRREVALDPGHRFEQDGDKSRHRIGREA